MGKADVLFCSEAWGEAWGHSVWFFLHVPTQTQCGKPFFSELRRAFVSPYFSHVIGKQSMLIIYISS